MSYSVEDLKWWSSLRVRNNRTIYDINKYVRYLETSNKDMSSNSYGK